jgi:hypothetical protein
VRGLQSTRHRQLPLPIGEPDPIQAVWDSFHQEAQERILRILARAIARILTAEREQR